jgi:SAM-dependent methyltransferase
MNDLGAIYTSHFYASQVDGSHSSAKVVVPLLIELFRPKSVIDVGCGVGTWLRVFADVGVPTLLGVDGDYMNPQNLLIPAEHFRALDLQQPLGNLGRFDMAVSLEVAEHLPPESAKAFIRELTSRSSVVVFSAAVPGQGGVNHINEQWPEYWEELFHEAGFVKTDPIRPQIWYNYSVEWWYRQNLFVFLDRALLEGDERLSALPRGSRDDDLTLVNKGVLKKHATPEKCLGLRTVLSLLPGLILTSLGRRLRRRSRTQ